MTKRDIVRKYIDVRGLFFKDCDYIDKRWWMVRDRYLTLKITSFGAQDECAYQIIEHDVQNCEVYFGGNKDAAFHQYEEILCDNIQIKWVNDGYDEED